MKVSIIPDDKTIVIDGKALTFDFSIDSNIHAIQWRDTWGNIEYKEGAQDWFDDLTIINPLIDAYFNEMTRLEQLQAQAEQAAPTV